MNKNQIEILESIKTYVAQAQASFTSKPSDLTPDEFAKIALVVTMRIDRVLKG